MQAQRSITQTPSLTFPQVFGTVVDWRTTVTNHLSTKSFEKLNAASSSIGMPTRLACAGISWPDFTQQWRTGYDEFTRAQAYRHGKDDPIAFKTVDDYHHDSLKELLVKHEIDHLWTDEEVLEISRIWHKLDGWSDSTGGLQALRNRGFIITTLSNGNLSLLTDMKIHAKLNWSYIFSAERFGAYKPHPSVYLGACKELGLQPGQCAMVAAHLGDLRAAKDCGLQTIYIERPEEESWDVEKVREAKRKGWVDMWVDSEENFVGGGILEVNRKFEIGTPL